MGNKPEAYFKYILAMDCETTGMFYGVSDPSQSGGEYYQPVSWGIMVLDADTLEPIEKLYVEIKWDKKSRFDEKAAKVHGLTKEYLEQHGITEEEACLLIGNLIYKYWETDSVITMGHNVATFDLPFLRAMMIRHGIELSFGNRHIDTNSIGFVALTTYTSDQLFEAVGLEHRTTHNALQDIEMTVEAARTVRMIMDEALGNV